jgi:serine protease Do
MGTATIVGAVLTLGACGSGSPSQPPPAPAGQPPTPPPQQLVATTPALPAPVPAAPPPSSLADLVDRVAPTVVNITAIHQPAAAQGRMQVDPFEFFFGRPERNAPRRPMPPRTAAGSGFIIDTNGIVVTNEHVVHGADEVKVRLLDDRTFIAEVVGRDRKLDLALLKLRGATGLPSAALGSEDSLRVGENVIAVGNPFGLGHTVTMGIVSAKSRTIGAGPYDDFIQTDASINPGNSGGPLFNLRGEVVGINTAIRAGADGIGFATPVDALKDVMGQLQHKGYVERGKLGLVFQPIDDSLASALGLERPRGALVTHTEPSSAAAKAGIQQGDIIVRVNGVEIRRAEELPRNVARHPPGAKIQVGLLRAGRPLTVTATLDKLEDEETPPPARRRGQSSKTHEMMGIELEDHPGGGVRIVGMDAPHGPRGLRVGDIIQEVDRKPIRDVTQLQGVMKRLHGKQPTALFKVKRGDRDLYVGVPLAAN